MPCSASIFDNFRFRPRVVSVTPWSVTVTWEGLPTTDHHSLEYRLSVLEDVTSLGSPMSLASSSLHSTPGGPRHSVGEGEDEEAVEEDFRSLPASFAGPWAHTLAHTHT